MPTRESSHGRRVSVTSLRAITKKVGMLTSPLDVFGGVRGVKGSDETEAFMGGALGGMLGACLWVGKSFLTVLVGGKAASGNAVDADSVRASIGGFLIGLAVGLTVDVVTGGSVYDFSIVIWGLAGFVLGAGLEALARYLQRE